METFGILGMTFGMFGFIFGLTAFSKVVALEEQLKKAGAFDESSTD